MLQELEERQQVECCRKEGRFADAVRSFLTGPHGWSSAAHWDLGLGHAPAAQALQSLALAGASHLLSTL